MWGLPQARIMMTVIMALARVEQCTKISSCLQCRCDMATLLPTR
jgi:hypothetical protein